MRDLFDRRLTDPTAAEVVEAIVAAEAAANAGHTTGNLTASGSSAPAMAERLLREPEGMNGHFGGANRPANIARLSMGWWTNSAGRKFVRVRSWREQSRRYGQDGYQTAEFDQTERDRVRRPGVWQVDHERVIEASSGGEPEWVAVCGCGAAGSPASLAWQHGMCGPCADRIAEFGPDSVKHAPGLLADTLEPLEAVALAPNGVILAGGSGWVRAWDAAGTVLADGWEGKDFAPELITPSLQVSPDGRFVLSNGSFRESLTFLDLAASPPQEFAFVIHEYGRAWWTGRASELLFQAVVGHDFFQLVDLDARSSRQALAPGFAANIVAVRSDPITPRVVVTVGHRGTLARIEGANSLVVESSFLIGEGRLNRTGMWQGGPEIVRFTPDGERLLFIRGAEMELRLPSRPKALLQATFPQAIRDAAFSPDYEHLFILGTDGIIYVCNPGTLTSVLARLRWHFWPPSRLAVSPDGQTLATAGPEGVKLWPVAQLMPLLG